MNSNSNIHSNNSSSVHIKDVNHQYQNLAKDNLEVEDIEESLTNEIPEENLSKIRVYKAKIHDKLEEIQSRPGFQRMVAILSYNPTPDDAVYYKQVLLIQDAAIVKLFKFVLSTLIFIHIIHTLARSLNWEHDEKYTMSEFYLYDFHSVMLDSFVFFMFGRLYANDRKGVDQLIYILPLIVGAIYPSWTNTWGFLRHSISMYEIVCQWPISLFEYVVGVAALDVYIIYLHFRDAYLNKMLAAKVVELFTCLLLFIAPMAGDSSFHLHHWFAAWLLGMHANSPKWWSRMTQAFLWGMYINGIAVYGRDPILGCAYSYFTSTSNFCSFMGCNLKFDDDDKNEGGIHYEPFIAPDWHHCKSN